MAGEISFSTWDEARAYAVLSAARRHGLKVSRVNVPGMTTIGEKVVPYRSSLVIHGDRDLIWWLIERATGGDRTTDDKE